MYTAGSVGIVGVSYGATAQLAGFQWWQAALIAVFVLGASSEFLFVGLIVAGAGPIAAASAALLVNARNVAYGMSAARIFECWPERLIGAHFVNDETIALSQNQGYEGSRRGMFWLSGAAILISWPTGAVIGAAFGPLLGSPETWGLDTVFPILLLSLLVPMVTDFGILRVAAGACALAVLVTPLVPTGVGALSALLGVALLTRTSPRPPHEGGKS